MLLNRPNQIATIHTAANQAQVIALVAGRTHLMYRKHRSMSKRSFSPEVSPSPRDLTHEDRTREERCRDAGIRTCIQRTVHAPHATGVTPPVVVSVVPGSGWQRGDTNRWPSQPWSTPATAWATLAINAALRG